MPQVQPARQRTLVQWQIALLLLILLTGCGRERQGERAAQPVAATPAPQAAEPQADAPTEQPTTSASTQPPESQSAESQPDASADQAATQAPVAESGEQSACSVAAIHFIGYGGEVDWSPDGEQLVFDRRDDAGIYQLHLIKPDGGGEVCISCSEVEGGPSLDRHKGFPAWHPSGDYIVTQVEMEQHWPIKALAEPGRGAWNNLFVVTPDGEQWWQLTEYSGAEATGVLNPRFSHDGTKLFWAEKYGRATREAPFAQWQLAIADFVVGPEGPHLENVTTFRPGEGSFYESHGFSRDDQKVLFTSDIGLANAFGLDVFLYTLATGELANLTNSPDEWDEHAAYAKHSDKIAFMSSACCQGFSVEDFGFTNLSELQAEAFIMDANGANWQQLTHFNTPGFAESNDEPSAATVVSWHPQGTRLAVAQLFTGASYDAREGRRLWIVDFRGACV